MASQGALKEENALWGGVDCQGRFHKEGAFEAELKGWVESHFHGVMSQGPFCARPSKTEQGGFSTGLCPGHLPKPGDW